MRRWAFLCVAAVAAVIVGCGGKGNGGASTNSTGTTAGATTGTRTSGATVSIPNKNTGLVYTAFLTGQGRSLNDVYLNIENESINDSFTSTRVNRQQVTPIRLHLAAYTFQFATIDVNTTGLNSELFDSITLVPFSFGVEQADGSVALNAGDPGYRSPDATDATITAPTRLRVYPGRDTVLPLFLNDAMFTDNGSTVSFDSTQFQTINEPSSSDTTISGKIAGYLSDMVQFDLSHVPAANVPALAKSGLPATHFYLSGDSYALSDDQPGSQSGNFEELTLDPLNPLTGTMGQPNSVQSQQFQFGNFPGTYDLRTADPTDLTGLSRITSLFGRWRKATDMIGLASTSFDLIIFPNSNESYAAPPAGAPADAVAIVHNGTTITNIYAGYAYFTGTGTPMAQLFPLPQFVAGQTGGEIDYDLSNFVGVNGATTLNEPSIRSGAFTKDAASGPLPTGFISSGTFIVFR